MTCPFYVCDGRPECILGDDRAERHCGPRQYPVGVCTLDEIGRGEAWRAVLWLVMPNAETIAGLTCAAEADRCNLLSMLGLVGFRLETLIFLDAVGWSP